MDLLMEVFKEFFKSKFFVVLVPIFCLFIVLRIMRIFLNVLLKGDTVSFELDDTLDSDFVDEVEEVEDNEVQIVVDNQQDNFIKYY